MTKTIIFDYDGTIHHTLGIYEPAFRETYQWLTEQKVTEEREIGSGEIAGWLGLNSKEMWNTFLSNCKASYREAHWKEFGMERWFDRFYDCESYRFRPKTEIVQEIIREYSGPYLVVGDRRQDLECARSCKSPFIGCLYGYGEKGELNGADYYAEHIEDILQMVI